MLHLMEAEKATAMLEGFAHRAQYQTFQTSHLLQHVCVCVEAEHVSLSWRPQTPRPFRERMGRPLWKILDSSLIPEAPPAQMSPVPLVRAGAEMFFFGKEAEGLLGLAHREEVGGKGS